MNTAKIKTTENRTDNLKFNSLFTKKASGWNKEVEYGVVRFPIKNKISVRKYEKENSVEIPCFHEKYGSYKKDAGLFKFGKDLYVTFTHRKEKRAVKLLSSTHHNQLYFNKTQL